MRIIAGVRTLVFQTDVRQVFDFIRYAEKKTDLYELVNNDPYYQSMDEDAFEVLVKYANIKEGTMKMADYKGKDGKMNMCKGIRDLMEDSKEEGISLGVIEAHRSIIANMMKMGKSMEEICCTIGCDAEYVQNVMQI